MQEGPPTCTNMADEDSAAISPIIGNVSRRGRRADPRPDAVRSMQELVGRAVWGDEIGQRDRTEPVHRNTTTVGTTNRNTPRSLKSPALPMRTPGTAEGSRRIGVASYIARREFASCSILARLWTQVERILACRCKVPNKIRHCATHRRAVVFDVHANRHRATWEHPDVT